MIEDVVLDQLKGTDIHGERHVFKADAVYATVAGVRKKVGYVDRKPNAKFAPLGKFTDAEREALIEAVNAARVEQGKFGPLLGYGASPPDAHEVEAAKAELEQEDDDDDSDD